jgi:hypothetical protein
MVLVVVPNGEAGLMTGLLLAVVFTGICTVLQLIALGGVIARATRKQTTLHALAGCSVLVLATVGILVVSSVELSTTDTLPSQLGIAVVLSQQAIALVVSIVVAVW